MINKLRVVLRKYPRLHSITSGLYRIFIWPFTSGYLLNMIRIFNSVIIPDIKGLKSKGFKNVRVYKSQTWRFGLERDKAIRRYYTGCYLGDKTFVKVSTNDSTIENEIDLAIYLNDRNYEYICPIVMADKTFSNNTMMLALQFIENVKSIEKPHNRVEFELLCKQLLDVTESIGTINVVHADIHKNNLAITEHGQLLLLDFGISMIIGKENKVNYSYRPGTFYREFDVNGVKKRRYDDSYSVIQMLLDMNTPNDWIQNRYFKTISDRVDKVFFDVDL